MNIKQANEIPADLWLERMEGIRPVKTSSGGHEVFYHSPLRDNDHTPSFVWNRTKNVWIDNGTEQAGKTFDLVKELRNTSAKETLEIIRQSGLHNAGYSPALPSRDQAAPSGMRKFKEKTAPRSNRRQRAETPCPTRLSGKAWGRPGYCQKVPARGPLRDHHRPTYVRGGTRRK